ncbi:unnamed protein product [Acanthoscelides obtectus]|uniref:Uncharacterized protein n=1 Tax=Acanthoscelides obtectus TaxID=200917 RepID=A0A9P0P780_ACAOB|nr:unnamed protein product [Acanthoscelides obtectus]CAK1631054.1 hypothetical protein AOBTE_LOCUS6730 [Acanthoscelides obtectus]
MVVGCRAQQLLKNGKNVSASFTTCVSMYSTAGFKYKNYVKSAIQNGIATDRFVRLYCDCRRAYSTDYQWPNEIKAGFTKLTAQEVSIAGVVAEQDEKPRWQAFVPRGGGPIHAVIDTFNNAIGISILESNENGVFFNEEAITKQFHDWLGNLAATVFDGDSKRQKIQALVESKVREDLAQIINSPIVQLGDKVGAIKDKILNRKTRSVIGNAFSAGKNVALRPISHLKNGVGAIKNKIPVRKTSSIIGKALSVGENVVLRPITSLVNKLLKEMLTLWFKESYEMLGKVVTLPIRALLEKIINTFLPCKSCPSLV